MASESLLAVLAALALGAGLTPLVIRLAPVAGLLDVPNSRSSHVGAVPRGGGIAVLIAFLAASAAAAPWSTELAALAGGTIALGTVGLLDDMVHLPAIPRLAAQVLVPLVAAAVTIDRAGAAIAFGLIVAVLWVASWVNAYNFMDGINGISASQAAIIAAFLAVVANDIGLGSIQVASWALVGAALGFLPYNAVRPRVFLGDVGSYGVGFALAAIGLLLWDAGGSALVLVGPFLLYLADTSTVLVRRWRRGDSLFEAHREHAYQRLTQAGWSHLRVTLLCAGVTAAAGGLMLSVLDSSNGARAAALSAACAIVIGYLMLVERFTERASGASA